MTTTTADIGPIAVRTGDLGRLREFYESVIGWRLVAIETALRPPVERLGIFAAGATPVLLAFEMSDAAPVTDDPGLGRRGPIDHFAVTVDGEADFDEIRRRLIAAGASDGTIVELGPRLSVLFQDPDGRALNLHRPNRGWTATDTLEVFDSRLVATLADPPSDREVLVR